MAIFTFWGFGLASLAAMWVVANQIQMRMSSDTSRQLVIKSSLPILPTTTLSSGVTNTTTTLKNSFTSGRFS
jgi:chloramphenicol O-acetyltransferase